MASAKSIVLAALVLSCWAAPIVAQDVTVPVKGNQVPVADVSDPQTGPTSRSGDTTVQEPDQTFSGSIAGIALTAGATDGDPEVSQTVDPTETEQGVSDATTNPGGAVGYDVGRVSNDIEGKRRKLLGGRKMLQGPGELELSGDGVGAGNDEAGVAANAYGHGQTTGDALEAGDTHIEPHGVDATVTADGKDTTVGAEANPDCVGTAEGNNEGPNCVGVEGK